MYAGTSMCCRVRFFGFFEAASSSTARATSGRFNARAVRPSPPWAIHIFSLSLDAARSTAALNSSNASSKFPMANWRAPKIRCPGSESCFFESNVEMIWAVSARLVFGWDLPSTTSDSNLDSNWARHKLMTACSSAESLRTGIFSASTA